MRAGRVNSRRTPRSNERLRLGPPSNLSLQENPGYLWQQSQAGEHPQTGREKAKASANQLDAEPIYPPPVHLNNGEAVTGHLNDIALGRNVTCDR